MTRPDNQRECFQCMNCDTEFIGPTDLTRGLPSLLSFPCKCKDCCICNKKKCSERHCQECKTKKLGGACREGACPKCGSKYVEWLTYVTKDTDVYLDAEWQAGTRCYEGNYKFQ